jgi:hypothetical protein
MALGGLEFLEWIRNARLGRSTLAAQHRPVNFQGDRRDGFSSQRASLSGVISDTVGK